MSQFHAVASFDPSVASALPTSRNARAVMSSRECVRRLLVSTFTTASSYVMRLLSGTCNDGANQAPETPPDSDWVKIWELFEVEVGLCGLASCM